MDKQYRLMCLLCLITATSFGAPRAQDCLRQGHAALARQDLKTANKNFQAALKQDPRSQEAAFMSAVTRLAVLANSPETEQMMTRMGIKRNGPVLFGWACTLCRDQYDRPILPRNAPTTREWRAYLNGVCAYDLDQAIAGLDQLTSAFSIILPAAETGLLTPTEIDYGDVCLGRAVLRVAKGLLCVINAYNIDLDIKDVTNRAYGGEPDLVQNLRKEYPAFLNFRPEAKAKANLAKLRPLLSQAVADYFAGTEWILSEMDDQADDLITIYPEDVTLLAKMHLNMNALRESLSAPARPFSEAEGRFQLNLGPLLAGQVNLRELLPDFAIDNEPLLATLPAPRFKSLIDGASFIKLIFPLDKALVTCSDKLPIFWQDLGLNGKARIAVHYHDAAGAEKVVAAGIAETDKANQLELDAGQLPEGHYKDFCAAIDRGDGKTVQCDLNHCDIQVRRTPDLAFGPAVGNTSIPWFTTRQNGWSVTTAMACAGPSSAISGPDGGELVTVIQGPALLSFNWMVTQPGSALSLELNGRPAARLSGAQKWTKRQQVIPEGPHVVTWTCKTPIGSPAGQGCVDRVQVLWMSQKDLKRICIQ